MHRTFVSFEEDAPLDAICEFLSRVTVRRVFIVRARLPDRRRQPGQSAALVRRRKWRRAVRPGRQRATAAPHSQSPATTRRRRSCCRVRGATFQAFWRLAHDPLAPVVERVRKIQDLIDALIASSQGKSIPIDLSESDSFPLSTVGYVPTALRK